MMKREDWNEEFITIFMNKTGLPLSISRQTAEANDDSFIDGLSPSESVDEELSYWNDGSTQD